MADRQPRAKGAFDRFIRLALIGVFGVILLVLGIAFLFSGGDEAAPITVAPNAQDPTTTTSPQGPEVAPIDACTLLDFDEAEEALGVSGDEGFFSISGGEACQWRTDSEQTLLVLGPATQDRFAPDSEVDGVTAVSGPDVGDVAVWFPGAETGTLSTATQTDIGILFVELALTRPDLDDSTRLNIATGLMETAIERIRFGPPPAIEADLCELVSDEDAEALLAPHREGRPGARDELFVIDDFSDTVDLADEDADANCQKLITTEIYVKATTSSPDDFGPGAEAEGVAGQAIDGLGDEATLFEDVPGSGSFAAPHDTDMVAVKFGDASFRIVVALPDLSADEQLSTARRLAETALLRADGGDVEIITIDHPEPDISTNGLVGNLHAKEQAGDWTRGEGLVASLRLILGEADESDVLIHPDMELRETTGIARMAYLYLEESEDEAINAELNRLLGRIFFTDDQLEEMSGAGAQTASLNGPWAAAATPEGCEVFFTGWDFPDGIDKCVEKRTVPGLVGYKVFGPDPSLPTAGWQEKHFDLVVQTLQESVPHFKALGNLPNTNIVLSVVDNPEAFAMAAPHLPGFTDRPCGVTLFTGMIGGLESDTDFKQVVAHELAHCFHGDTFPAEFPAVDAAWWDEGLAEYWSNTVPMYAKNNLEHRARLPEFDPSELSSTVLDRSYANFIFFQQMANSYTNQGILALIRSLPDGGGTKDEQRAALGNFGGMSTNYHEFAKKVSDVSIVDTGGGVIPNAPDSDPHTWSQPVIIIDDPPTFGVTRLAVAVPNGMYACLSHEVSSDVELSWREGRPGVPTGAWSSGLPDVLSGEAVIVATTTKPEGQLTIEVEHVADNEDCEEDEEQDETDSNANGPCLDICGISDYYRYPEALQDWVVDLLPPLSPPQEP